MKQSDIIYNKVYLDGLNEEFTFVQDNSIQKDFEFLIRFNKTNNYQLAYASSSFEKIRDYSIPKLYGIGYATGTKENPVKLDYSYYSKWSAMIMRCYKDGGIKSYEDVTVCNEWHNFTNFKEWAKNNNFNREFCIDKDLFGGKNRIYSPNTCCFLPKEINSCIIGLGKTNPDSIMETRAKTIYHLSLLIDKYDGILSKKVKDKLFKIISGYKSNYKRITGRNLNSQFIDFQIEKIDLSKISITAFVDYCGYISRFNNLEDLKKFVLEKEKKEVIRTKSPLINNIL